MAVSAVACKPRLLSSVPASTFTTEVAAAALGREVEAVHCVQATRALDQSDVTVFEVVSTTPSPAPLLFLHKYTSLAAQRVSRPSRTEAAWRATARSFANEAAFLACADVDALRAAGAYLPRPIVVSASSGPEPSEDQEIALVTEFLPPAEWQQVHVLQEAQALTAVRWLAAFHAHYFLHPPLAGTTLLDSGGWWKQRPDLCDYGTLPEVYVQMLRTFGSDGDRLAHGEGRVLEHLTRISLPAARAWLKSQLEPTGRRGSLLSTLVHGDFKPSNVFFRAGGGVGEGEPSMAAIDFQWAGPGFGSGAADLAYFMCGAVHASLLLPKRGPAAAANRHFASQLQPCRCGALLEEIDSDLWLVAEYFCALHHRITTATASTTEDGTPAVDKAACWDWPAVLRLFKLELLDYAKTAIPYLHAGMTASDFASNAHRHGFLMHEHDADVLMWMCSRAARYVSELYLNDRGSS